jgi:hypothetical protein
MFWRAIYLQMSDYIIGRHVRLPREYVYQRLRQRPIDHSKPFEPHWFPAADWRR